MLTFALDTSTQSPSVALTRDGGMVGELWLGPDPVAGRRVLEAAHHLFAATGMDLADVRRIVVGIGPGGFTGLRIGLATAHALAQAVGCDLVGVVSLEALGAALAEIAGPGALVVPAHDARRREVFAAAYRVGPDLGLAEVLAPLAIGPRDLAAVLAPLDGPMMAGGTGAILAAGELAAAGVTVPPAQSAAHRLRAAALVPRADAGAGRPPLPLYARLPDAELNRRAGGSA